MRWLFPAVIGCLAAIVALLTIICATISVVSVRDKKKLYTPAERLFTGIGFMLLSALCGLGTMGLAYFALNFSDIVK